MKQQLTKEAVYQTAKESFGIVPPMIKEIAEFSVPVAALYVNGVNVMGLRHLVKLKSMLLNYAFPL